MPRSQRKKSTARKVRSQRKKSTARKVRSQRKKSTARKVRSQRKKSTARKVRKVGGTGVITDAPIFSVVTLENHDTYGYKEFQCETSAVNFFKNEVQSYQKSLDEYSVNYDVAIDAIASMLKMTFSDDSDKIMSYLICGLPKDKNKKLASGFKKPL